MNLENELKISGLSAQTAKTRLEENGYNEITLEKPRTLWHFIFNVLREPMILLLLSSAGIYFFLGDPKEAGILLISVLAVVIITIYQQQKTEKSLQALKSLASPIARVIRDSQEIKIPAREVVQGDIIVFSEGDKIPADAKILTCTNTMVDESILTGESVAVTKTKALTDDLSAFRPGGDNVPIVYSGTLVTRGHGAAEVFAVGLETQMGHIGQELQSLNIDHTLLQKEVSRVVKTMALAGLFFCFVLILVYGLMRSDWTNAFLAGITLAMSALPEEFPIVLTLFLTMGAWRLAQNKVLARRAAVIETLGNTSVLCVDKTGTLTQNKMVLAKIFYQDRYFEMDHFQDNDLKEILRFGVLASQKNPFDPMEKAFLGAGEKYLTSEDIYADLVLKKEYPLEEKSMSVLQAYEYKNGKTLVAAKGSPEAIFSLCHLEKDKVDELIMRSNTMAQMGLRVIAVARGSLQGSNLPLERHDFVLNFIGLVGLSDPIKAGVKEAIELCYEAGIRVVMITGDFPQTAKNIASQIGLRSGETVIEGSDLDHLNEEELISKISQVTIFSRVIPAQKLKIVNAFKKMGEVVAMTGDGVNDAPALKSAHIGIAMGQKGTDVAKEAAAIILLDDNFVSIVGGIRLGRRIYANLKKAMTYIFAVHIPIIGLSLLQVFLGWPLILFPVHIVFLELIIDPVCTIVFESEKEDSDIMQKKPKKLFQPIFDRKMIFTSLSQGLVALAMVIVSYGIAIRFNLNEEQLRTFVFSTIVFSNLFLIVANRSWQYGILKTVTRKNIAFFSISVATILMLLLSIYLPALNHLFKFESITFQMLLLTFLLGGVSVIWFDIYKYFFVKR